jgi:hypothetical protein
LRYGPSLKYICIVPSVDVLVLCTLKSPEVIVQARHCPAANGTVPEAAVLATITLVEPALVMRAVSRFVPDGTLAIVMGVGLLGRFIFTLGDHIVLSSLPKHFG